MSANVGIVDMEDFPSSFLSGTMIMEPGVEAIRAVFLVLFADPRLEALGPFVLSKQLAPGRKLLADFNQHRSRSLRMSVR